MPRTDRSFIQRLIRWRYLVVVNLIVVLFLSMSLGREVVRNSTIDAEISALETEAEELTARNIEISELKTAMQTESFIEREARLKLGMKKPGETVVVVQDDVPQQEQLTDDAYDPLGYVMGMEESREVVANPTKWWYYFFDKTTFDQINWYE